MATRRGSIRDAVAGAIEAAGIEVAPFAADRLQQKPNTACIGVGLEMRRSMDEASGEDFEVLGDTVQGRCEVVIVVARSAARSAPAGTLDTLTDEDAELIDAAMRAFSPTQYDLDDSTLVVQSMGAVSGGASIDDAAGRCYFSAHVVVTYIQQWE